MPSYSELLRDPRWQKTRLLKLEAAGWKCECCMDSETTLHVHHKRYVKGRMPWEYDAAELAVLCAPCHEEQHGMSDLRAEYVARLAADGPVSTEDFFAYGVGALSTFDWLLDDTQRELAGRIAAGKWLQFGAGHIGSLMAEFLCSTRKLRIDDVVHVGDLISVDDDFRQDLAALLAKHGVKCFRGSEGDLGA